jgi:hypothetical protein
MIKIIIKVPPLTTVYDVSGFAAFNSVSPNPNYSSTHWFYLPATGAAPLPLANLSLYLWVKLPKVISVFLDGATG